MKYLGGIRFNSIRSIWVQPSRVEPNPDSNILTFLIDFSRDRLSPASTAERTQDSWSLTTIGRKLPTPSSSPSASPPSYFHSQSPFLVSGTVPPVRSGGRTSVRAGVGTWSQDQGPRTSSRMRRGEREGVRGGMSPFPSHNPSSNNPKGESTRPTIPTLPHSQPSLPETQPSRAVTPSMTGKDSVQRTARH